MSSYFDDKGFSCTHPPASPETWLQIDLYLCGASWALRLGLVSYDREAVGEGVLSLHRSSITVCVCLLSRFKSIILRIVWSSLAFKCTNNLYIYILKLSRMNAEILTQGGSWWLCQPFPVPCSVWRGWGSKGVGNKEQRVEFSNQNVLAVCDSTICPTPKQWELRQDSESL